MPVPQPIPIPNRTFESRRAAVLDRLGAGVLVLPAAPLQHASRDTERPYAPDRELYWLSGLVEPGTVAVLTGGDEPTFEAFVRERDPDAETWNGPRLGPEGTAERFAVTCHPLSELPDRLPALLARGDRIHYRPGRTGRVEAAVFEALVTARSRGARTGRGPRGIVDPGVVLDDLRLVKDDQELERIRAACAVTLAGHRAAAAVLSAGCGEWEVEAALEHAFRAGGATGPAFESIVGAGANACILHYVDNEETIGDGDLVLVDAGAEMALYAGDVTRTYPASGSFGSEQLDVYALVDAAREAAIRAVRPGATIGEVHDAAVRTLTEGLSALGVLHGAVDGLIEEEAYKPFFPHQTSHWLGLDVHDPGDYARNGESRRLEPGMVLTIEPGLYFGGRSSLEGARRYDGIGVRIEDDVVVTSDGCEVLTSDLPTGADAVEGLVDR